MSNPSLETPSVAVVTGATSGIGVATARRLHRDGFTVLVTGRSTERGEAAVAGLGPDAHFSAADLTKDGEPERLLQHVARHIGRVDVVVNNAAVDHTGDLLQVPGEEVRDTFEINTFAAIAVLQAAGRAMRDTGGGVIVNVTSRLASVGVPTMGVYSASKGAIKALTTAAAVELAPYNIRVNAVAPGMTRTPLYEAWLSAQQDPEAVARDVVDGIPLGRLASPEDVAGAISFLASLDAAYITGATLPVDGGYTAR
jgi:NAD(P)-dependent dehydrogenase (short-subunit alcohol dehydrogenase family)